MELIRAINIALALGGRLAPDVKKFHVAGSVRRAKSEVKDIEIVCLPKYETVITGTDIFGTGIEQLQLSKSFITTVFSMGTMLKGNPGGRYVQILLPEGINLDLFIPQDYDYYRQLAIRTGPAEYSYATLAVGWRKQGWCGTKEGLRLMSDCQEHKQCSGKSIWNCVNPTPELPPHWQSEREFYDWIKVPWLEPSQRG
jgi:DNA polymerase/3'-5' exonuclease PolX